jgi:murein DD-endopeptidase MepM/ murein hydrolase activator NlpD
MPQPSLPLVATVAALVLAGCASRGSLPGGGTKAVKAGDLPAAVQIADGAGGTIQLQVRDLVEGGSLSSGFGWRGHAMGGSGGVRHEGIDIVAPKGTPVHAAASGTVEDIGWRGAYGRLVVLRHGGRIETAYAHLSRFADDVRVGRRVRQGEVIGYVGSSGRSNGPHLHYEVRRDSKPVDPLDASPPRPRMPKRTQPPPTESPK